MSDTKMRANSSIRSNGRTGVDIAVRTFRDRLMHLVRSSPVEDLTDTEGMAVVMMLSQRP